MLSCRALLTTFLCLPPPCTAVVGHASSLPQVHHGAKSVQAAQRCIQPRQLVSNTVNAHQTNQQGRRYLKLLCANVGYSSGKERGRQWGSCSACSADGFDAQRSTVLGGAGV